MERLSVSRVLTCTWLAVVVSSIAPLSVAQDAQPSAPSSQPSDQSTAASPSPDGTFRLGEIVYVLGKEPGSPGVGGVVVSHEQLQTFERHSLDQAVNLAPGVTSTLDSNGRRNESDIFVRGFGRWQVPLMVDGVRIYLPADNRLDFARFLTADIAAIQIQKGYASVLDGPGAMGGAINLVTMSPTKPLQVEGGISAGGRDVEGWSAYALVGTRQPKYFALGSVTRTDRDSWSLSSDYTPTANSLQPSGKRIASDSEDWRLNVKLGYTPTPSNEYTLNYTKQAGEKGAPLNVYNNPPVPANSYWRWPWWDVQTLSLVTTTQLAPTAYLKAKAYYNVYRNALDAFDDGTYTTQSANGRFHSPYDDHAYGTSLEFGVTPIAANTLKAAFHYRTDIHEEQQTSRPTHPTLSTSEPTQEQSQYTWSAALEDTLRLAPTVDLVAGVSFDKYAITKAQEYNATRGLFEYPRGGSDAMNWQAALVWRHADTGEWHASISDRARFPVIFELYSTRFGTATPNPDLGPERSTNIEVGWTRSFGATRLTTAGFYSHVRDLIQTVVLPDTTTQTQNVGTGRFGGLELSVESALAQSFQVGGNYTFIHREITDALQPNLRPTGVPTHKAFLYATWHPIQPLRVTPSLELADDRWSDKTTSPVAPFPYVETGAYRLLNLDASWMLASGLELGAGFKNLLDDYYELAWGFPQPGRTFYVKTRVQF